MEPFSDVPAPLPPDESVPSAHADVTGTDELLPPPESDQPAPPHGADDPTSSFGEGEPPLSPGAGGGTERLGPRVLRRDVNNRILGGVAAGVADYVSLDPAIIRIVFIVLSVFGGSGVLLYLAGWLLIPSDHSGRSVAQEWAVRPPPRRSIVVMVVGVVLALIAVSDLFSSGPWWPHWNHGFGFGLAVVALALVIAFMAGSSRKGRGRSRLRWLVITTLVATAAMVAVSVATLFTVEAVSGVPLSGGIGASQWHPVTPSQVKPRYQLAMGNLVVDLSGVDFRQGTTDVKATVGIGRVYVEVPTGTSVSVTAHSGLGAVQIFGQNNGGFDSAQTMQSSSPVHGGHRDAHIVLNAQVGVGQVEVVRAA